MRSFTSKDPALTINYIGFVFRRLRNNGYSTQALLENTNLQEKDLLDPDYRCTFEQHKQFALNAMMLTNDAHLGPRMAASYNPINFGLPVMAAVSSDKFSTALKIFKKYISLNFSIMTFDYFQDGDSLIINYQPSVNITDEEYFVLGSCLVLSEMLWKFLLGQETQVTLYAELTLPEPPDWVNNSNVIGFPVYFNRPFNRIVLPISLMNQNLSANDPILHQHMLRLCKKHKSESFYKNGLEAQLRNFIVAKQYSCLSSKHAAKAMGMSERQLRRQLSDSGTSYKHILADVRVSRAKELLAVPGLPVSTIAYDLGFRDPSNFARTFKRCTGKSPIQFRASTVKNDH